MDAEAEIRRGTDVERAGDRRSAEAAYRQALAATRGTGAVPERAALANLARLCADDGREFEALAFAIPAARLCASAGDAWGEALAHLHLANVLHNIEDYARVPAELRAVEMLLPALDSARATRLRFSLAIHRARLVASLGDVGSVADVLAAAEASHHAALGEALPARLRWLVSVGSLLTAGRFAEASAGLADMPPREGNVRKDLEVDELRVRCLLGTDIHAGAEAARALLHDLAAAPWPSVGAAWRLRMTSEIGAALPDTPEVADVSRQAWTMAGEAIVRRILELEECVRHLPELADTTSPVLERLVEYRERFRERHEAVMRAVAAVLPWPPAELPVDDTPGCIVVCAWCTRVRGTAGLWVPIGQYLPAGDQAYAVSHGICPACLTTAGGSPAHAVLA